MKKAIAIAVISDQQVTRSVSEGQAASIGPSLTRRVTRFCAALSTLLLAASTGFAEDKPNISKPNIIIIMPDDSGYGNHSCFGNPVIQTPNIDALAKQSLLLTRYHSSARCSPSRAKLLSGCLLYTSPSPRDLSTSRMPSSA